MKKTVFTGSGVAIATPMDENGAIRYDALTSLINWQIERGTDAIIICGTTGENPTMSDEEQINCFRTAVEAAGGRVPVVAGTGSNNTHHAVELSRAAKEAGADGLLLVTPYYNKTSQTGLVRHFNTVADATDLPIILYNVPARTGMGIKPQTYTELVKHPNIVATKEASGDISAIAETMHLCGGELDLYSGNDDQIVPLMSLGGVGVISVLANVMPKETHEICALFLAGKTKEAAELQLRLIPMINALFCDVNPIPVKAAMNLMGLDVGPCRLPLCEMSVAGTDQLKGAMKRLGLIS